jgi:cell division protein FtsI (penicillin-binding protein 3)
MNDRIHYYRLKLIKIIFLGLTAWVFINLVRYQLFDPFKLKDATSQMHFQKKTETAKRGSIFDRNGLILAQPLTCFDFYLDPKAIKEKKDTLVNKLVNVLDLDSATIDARVKGDKTFTLAKGIFDKALYYKILEIGSPAIYPHAEIGRFYPQGRVGSHVVGFIRPNNNDKSGLELSLDKYLTGKDGYELLLQDANGKPVVNPNPEKKKPTEGYNVILTIDARIQKIAQEVLDAGCYRFSAQGGALVVMNPRTGEIYALASSPSYNPNRIDEQYDNNRILNRPVSWIYEQGSTAKVFVAAAALENQVVTTDSIFYCEAGSWDFANKMRLNEAENHSFKWMTVRDILIYSSNIGAAKVGMSLGPDLFYKSGRDFGFGLSCDIDLPNEKDGYFPPPQEWGKYNLVFSSIGQGFSVTPLILARAISTIANDGVMMKPFLVSSIVDNNGNIIEKNEPSVIREVISKTTAAQITQILVQAVEVGTGYAAKIDGVSVAGKTGTAQKSTPGHGYIPGKYVASFIGYFPADDPQIAIVVSIDEPQGAYYAADVAAPVFRKVAEYILATPNDAVNGSLVHRYISTSPEIQNYKSRPVIGGKMPNLIGLSVREAISQVNQLNKQFTLKGTGWVIDQFPKAGSALNNATNIQIKGSLGG